MAQVLRSVLRRFSSVSLVGLLLGLALVGLRELLGDRVLADRAPLAWVLDRGRGTLDLIGDEGGTLARRAWPLGELEGRPGATLGWRRAARRGWRLTVWYGRAGDGARRTWCSNERPSFVVGGEGWLVTWSEGSAAELVARHADGRRVPLLPPGGDAGEPRPATPLVRAGCGRVVIACRGELRLFEFEPDPVLLARRSYDEAVLDARLTRGSVWLLQDGGLARLDAALRRRAWVPLAVAPRVWAVDPVSDEVLVLAADGVRFVAPDGSLRARGFDAALGDVDRALGLSNGGWLLASPGALLRLEGSGGLLWSRGGWSELELLAAVEGSSALVGDPESQESDEGLGVDAGPRELSGRAADDLDLFVGIGRETVREDGLETGGEEQVHALGAEARSGEEGR